MIMKLQISRTFVSSSNHDDATCGDLSGRGAGRAPCPRAWPARAPAPARTARGADTGPAQGTAGGPRTRWRAYQQCNIIINCTHYHDFMTLSIIMMCNCKNCKFYTPYITYSFYDVSWRWLFSLGLQFKGSSDFWIFIETWRALSTHSSTEPTLHKTKIAATQKVKLN